MEQPFLNQKLASFCYGGKKIILSLKNMDKESENVYTLQLTKGLKAILEYSEPNKNSFTCMLKFKNTGNENTLQITQPKTLDMTVTTIEPSSILWQSLKGDSCGQESFMPLIKKLSAGETYHVEPRGGRSSDTTGFPYFDITYGDKSLICAIGWTGQWSQDIVVGKNDFTILIGLCDADFYLKPGEEVRLPSVLCMKGGQTQKLRHNFRQLELQQFSPMTRLGKDMNLPLALQLFDRYSHDRCPEWSTEAGQIHSIQRAASCQHLDTLWLDAAWFKDGFPNGVGNYGFADGFPNGLKKVSDAAHEHGMKFMLWFEPERIRSGTEVFRDHAEMLLSIDTDPDTKLFNLGNGEARRWLTHKLINFIHKNGVDIYRQDFNMDPLPYWRAADEENRHGITEMKYVSGMYAFWDALIEEFPNLMIDNCSSGGRRIDFETCKRAVPLWRSDTGCSPANEKNHTYTWNQNQILGLTNYLAFHACAVWEPVAYDVRSAQSGGLACAFDVLNNAFDFSKAEKLLAEVKNMQNYWKGDFYPITQPATDETGWAAYQFALADSGACYIFRRDLCKEPNFALPFRAVNPNRFYLVRMSDEQLNKTEKTVSGKDLLSGYVISIPYAHGSVLLEYEEIKNASSKEINLPFPSNS